MKYFILILSLFTNVLFNQSSSLSLYGLGERIYSNDASSASLGDIRLFSSNNINFTLSSPSTYCNNNQTNLSMTTAFNTLKSKSIDKLSSNNFTHLSFGFPITNKQYFLLGLNPLIRSNINMQESDFKFIGANNSNQDIDNDGIIDPLAYKNSYGISGGISEIYVAISTVINKNISMGFKIGKLFGTTEVEDTLNFYNVLLNQDGTFPTPILLGWPSEIVKERYNHSAFNYLLDARFNIQKNNIALYYGQSEKMIIDIIHLSYSPTLVETIIYNQEITQTSLKGLKEYGIGIKCNLNNYFSYIIELHKFNTFSHSSIVNSFSLPPLNFKSFNLGFIYKINQFKNLKLNSINVNFGLYHRLYKSNNSIQIPLINDFGVSLGFEIEYLNSNSLAIGLQVGKRYTDLLEFDDETYYKLILSLKSNSDWFVKERN